MQVVAKLNYFRIAPRKIRLVADLIRNKPVERALSILRFTTKKSSQPMTNLLKSAIANAKNNFQLDSNSLYISQIKVDEGPKLKRGRPRARGVVGPIQKKTSHITLILEGEKKEEMQQKKEISKSEIKEKKELTQKTRKEIKEKFLASRQGVWKKQTRGLKRIFKRKAF